MSDVKEPIRPEETVSTEGKPSTPLDVIIGSAKSDMMMTILGIQKQYGLPAYMTELILSSCLSDIRDIVNKDLILNLSKT